MQKKFASSLALSLALEKLICTSSIQKYVYILQSYPAGCSLSNHITKDSIVIQQRLIGKSALTTINRISPTESKASLQIFSNLAKQLSNNTQQSFFSKLLCLPWVSVYVLYSHIMINIFNYFHMAEVVT